MRTRPIDLSNHAESSGSVSEASNRSVNRPRVANRRRARKFRRQQRDSESIGSLLRRLGTPPNDLATQLVDQFRETCEQYLTDGAVIPSVNLEDWHIDDQGQMIYHSTSVDEGAGAENALTLTSHFQQLLSVPRPLGAGRTHKSPVVRKTGGATVRFDYSSDPRSALSRRERRRRERLVRQFTESLAQRFGEDEIEPEPDPIPSLPFRIARDHRINWNIAFGVGSTVAVLLMIWVGVRITDVRQRRAARAIAAGSVALPDGGVNRGKVASAVTARSLEKPTIMPEELRVLSLSPASTFNDEGEPEVGKEAVEYIEELPAIANARTAIVETVGTQIGKSARSRISESDLSVDNDLREGLKPEEVLLDISPELRQPNAQGKTFTSQSVGESTETDDPFANAFESLEQADTYQLQKILRAHPDVVELPHPIKLQARALVDHFGRSIVGIEFPAGQPLALTGQLNHRAGQGRVVGILNQTSGNVIARLIGEGSHTYFQWTEKASEDRLSAQLPHGCLIDEDGRRIDLLPEIAASPYGLSMQPNFRRPSWNLAAPIRPAETCLDVSLSVPESIDVTWPAPFNPTRPSQGSAIAVLSPAGDDSVSIAVKMNLDCSDRLTCQFQYGARLDSSFPWQSFSVDGWNLTRSKVTAQIKMLRQKLHQYDQRYASADLMASKLMRPERPKIVAELKSMESTDARLLRLAKLAETMEDQVQLNLHLYVQWPDRQQTLLKTWQPDTIARK